MDPGSGKDSDDAASRQPLVIETERDLRANIRQICRRLDANPQVSRLLFINPLLVLEDVGVQMSPAVREHIMQALRFPPKRRERIARLEAELAALAAPPPETGDAAQAAAAAACDDERPPPAPDDAVLAAKRAELVRLRQGALVFFPRATFEQFKRGEKTHRWIRAVRFGV